MGYTCFMYKGLVNTLKKEHKLLSKFFTLSIAILIVLMSLSANSEKNTKETSLLSDSLPSEQFYKVTNVVDGDTLDVLIDGKTERLRLIGIDTPETVDPRKPVQCFGIEASSKAKELLIGQEVRLEADSTQGERDKYNRLLRYVFLKDGTNFIEKMLGEGYGYEYTYDMPYKYQSTFKKAETLAQTNKKGLWADNACAKNLPAY